MLKLPPDFIFSQSNLHDYLECPRRFYLRYVRRLLWPSVVQDGNFEAEAHLLMAQAFHRLAQQKATAIPAEKLESIISTQPFDLQRWWQSFINWWDAAQADELQGERYPEFVLTASLGNSRLIAKYDLLVVHPDRTVSIYDWKTVRQRPPSSALRQHVQSRLYPYLLAKSGSTLNQGQPFLPQQIQMTYWFTAEPLDPEQFTYSAEQLQADEAYLTSLTEDILGRTEEDFPLTFDENRCARCVYRTYCSRAGGETAPSAAEDESDRPPLQFPEDWEQIGEIEY
ncbi:MAG: PD-(D/E)XK nuclease family protein [Chloroflexota bacterium]